MHVVGRVNFVLIHCKNLILNLQFINTLKHSYSVLGRILRIAKLRLITAFQFPKYCFKILWRLHCSFKPQEIYGTHLLYILLL